MKSLIKQMKKERWKIENEYFNFYKKIDITGKVLKYKNDIWLPNNNIILNKVNGNTCFDIKESPSYNNKFVRHTYNYDKYEGSLIKAKQIILKFNNTQQIIVKKWMDAYMAMYNETLKYIKEQYKINNKMKIDWINIRKILVNKRNTIIECSGDKNNQIKVHDIDYAIKLACSTYKSAITNFKLGYIKSFRIRYWRQNKENKILDLEKNNFISGSIRRNVLGEVIGYYNGKKFDFSTIDKDCRLAYKNNKYYLYVPENVNKKKSKKQNKVISLDPGIRTFLTGITENKIVEIGHNLKDNVKKYIKRKEKTKENQEIPKKIKTKIEKTCNKKIRNIIDEVHWQTINYLTSNYEKIFIGNLSTKNIVSNKNVNNLSSMTKKMAQIIRLYEFKQRLQYKCEIRGVKYKCVDEKYTSKICSNCGNIKEDLGDAKIYECNKCGIKIGRDVNGSRMIYIKNIKK